MVAVLVDHVRQTEVGLADGRQDPGQQHVDAALVGDGSHPGEELVQLRLHGAEAVATEALRIEVELEVEGTELGREVRVVDGVEDLERDRRRLPAAVDEEHLLLGADAPHAVLDAALGEHALEGVHVAQQGVGELPAVLSAVHSLQPRRCPRPESSRRIIAHALHVLVEVLRQHVPPGLPVVGPLRAPRVDPVRDASRAEHVRHAPRLADVLVGALAAGEHDEAGAQPLEQCAILVEGGRKCSGEAARKSSSIGPLTKRARSYVPLMQIAARNTSG